MIAGRVQADALGRVQRWALAGAAAGVVALLVAAFFSLDAFFKGYLAAYVLWIGLGLGALSILLLHHLTGGRWGRPLRAPLEAATLTLPLMALLFVPVLFGIGRLYPWHGVEHEPTHALIAFRGAWLNTPGFIGRSVVYFAGLLVIGWALARPVLSRERREESEVYRTRIAAGGAVAFVLLTSFAFIDWVASLEKDWYSTIYGIYLLAGQALGAFALAALLTVWISLETWRAAEGDGENEKGITRPGPGDYADVELLPPDRLHDFGNLLLMLVVFYAYLAYSQFFIIWNGNLPVEIPWYVHRSAGVWGAVAITIILAQFALPFAALLFRKTKRHVRPLLAVVVLVLIARVLDTAWFVLPSFDDGARAGTLLVSAAAAVGLGGACLTLMLGLWRRRLERDAAAGASLRRDEP